MGRQVGDRWRVSWGQGGQNQRERDRRDAMSMVESRLGVVLDLSPCPTLFVCPYPPMHPIGAEGGGEIPAAMCSTSPNVFPGQGRGCCWETHNCANGARGNV